MGEDQLFPLGVKGSQVQILSARLKSLQVRGLGGHENRGRAMNVHPEDRCFTLRTEPSKSAAAS